MAETKVEIKDVEDGFFGMTKRATELKKEYWKEVKPFAKKDLRSHGRKRQGPNGPWPGISDASRKKNKRRRSQGKKAGITGKLGAIPSAWKTYQDPEQIKFRQMVDWADAHNQGGVAGRGARMPKREFAYFSDNFESFAGGLWQGFIADGWEKKTP